MLFVFVCNVVSHFFIAVSVLYRGLVSLCVQSLGLKLVVEQVEKVY